MDFSDLIKKRKTCYEFDENKRIPANHLKKILKAAQWAPSCSNIQPWHFIVIKDKSRISSLLDLTHFVDSPTIRPSPKLLMAVISEPSCLGPGVKCSTHEPESKKEDMLLSIGIAVSQAFLQAEILGINSCILTPERNKTNRLLGIRKPQEAVLLLGLGYEKKGAFQKKRVRKKLSEIVSYEKYKK